MLIAIDIGNTSTTVGVYEGLRLLAHWRIDTKKDATAEQMEITYKDLFEKAGYRPDQIDGAIVSNVVPSIQDAVTNMSRCCFDKEPVYVSHENAGIQIEYPNPSEIGADRLANAVAAYEKYKDSIIVVDFGTATTFDYIDSKGTYCGGVIAPGIKIANGALHTQTSKLPRVDIMKTRSIIGKSTISAIQSGVYHGYVGLVAGILEKMKAEVGILPHIVATGGLAGLVAGDMGIEIERFLTLEGLRLIYNRTVISAKAGI